MSAIGIFRLLWHKNVRILLLKKAVISSYSRVHHHPWAIQCLLISHWSLFPLLWAKSLLWLHDKPMALQGGWAHQAINNLLLAQPSVVGMTLWIQLLLLLSVFLSLDHAVGWMEALLVESLVVDANQASSLFCCCQVLARCVVQLFALWSALLFRFYLRSWFG